MPDDVEEAQAALDRLHLVGSARSVADLAPADLAHEIMALFDRPGFRLLSSTQRGSALFRVLLIYSGSWQAEGLSVRPAVERAFADLVADAPEDIDALCCGYDALFFLYWCYETSIVSQQGFGTHVVAPFAEAIRRNAPPPDKRPAKGIGYLAMFVTNGPGNAIADANRIILESLQARTNGEPVILYAWMFHDETTLQHFAGLGIQVRAIVANSPAERIAKLETLIREDRPDVLISDMNGAVPAVLFERRVAPLQILYQFGMPHWPLANLDGVFRVWDFDPVMAGYDPARCLKLNVPYDLTPFTGPADPVRLAAERARLPAGRLIGTYGRLSKITPNLVQAVADAILDSDDVTVVFGGSGDAVPLRAAIERTGIPGRFAIVEGFVDGHLWGHLLEVFLDTYPLPGGASCLEVIAKGKPVVAMLTLDAPNLSREQRVPSLVAQCDDEYSKIVSNLLNDPNFYADACKSTHELAASYHRAESYGADFFKALAQIRDLSRPSALARW